MIMYEDRNIYRQSLFLGKALLRKKYNNQSLRKIGEAYKFFEHSYCGLIVCLGDMIDTEPTEDVYISVHQNIDPEIRSDHRIFIADNLFTLINENSVVKAVFQGHYHPGYRSKHDSIKYVTLPAMCENENAFWIFDL